MSTAIVWIYTPAGFVIGADGRRMDSGLVASDSVQKIFGRRMTNVRLAFAWSGTINVTRMDGVIFDLKEVTDIILPSIGLSSVSVFSDLIESFNEALYALLLAYFRGGVKSFPKEEIARGVFLAYFREQPFAAEIFIKHDGCMVLKPEIKLAPLEGPLRVFTGSQQAHEALKPRILEPVASSLEASALVRDYIKLCMEYRDSDPDSVNIGGHVHIGQLTPRGFSWIDPPLLR